MHLSRTLFLSRTLHKYKVAIIKRNLDELLGDEMIKEVWARNLRKTSKIMPDKIRKSPELLERINDLLRGCYDKRQS